MRRPAIMLYVADWRSNAKLRRCSWAARGAWIEVIALMHDADDYGVLHWPLKEIAQAVGCPLSLLRELADKTVLKGKDAGQCEPYVYIPRTAGRDGAPVTLIPEQSGPIWYSSRMVRDEHVRLRRGDGSRFGSESKGPPKEEPKPIPKGGLVSGPSVAVAVSSSEKDLFRPSDGASAKVADPIFGGCLTVLTAKGVPEKSARSTLGMLRRDIGDAAVIELVAKVEADDISEPIAWLMKAAKSRASSAPVRASKGVHIGEQNYSAGWGQ